MQYIKRHFLISTCAASMVGLFVLPITVLAEDHQSASPPAAGMAKGSMMQKDDMSSMPMSGDTDKDFAMMMKMHHQKAIEMAKKELADGKAPAMKAMAKKIIAAQQKEIAEFDQWLGDHK